MAEPEDENENITRGLPEPEASESSDATQRFVTFDPDEAEDEESVGEEELIAPMNKEKADALRNDAAARSNPTPFITRREQEGDESNKFSVARQHIASGDRFTSPEAPMDVYPDQRGFAAPEPEGDPEVLEVTPTGRDVQAFLRAHSITASDAKRAVRVIGKNEDALANATGSGQKKRVAITKEVDANHR
jgi:hypothetical protein